MRAPSVENARAVKNRRNSAGFRVNRPYFINSPAVRPSSVPNRFFVDKLVYRFFKIGIGDIKTIFRKFFFENFQPFFFEIVRIFRVRLRENGIVQSFLNLFFENFRQSVRNFRFFNNFLFLADFRDYFFLKFLDFFYFLRGSFQCTLNNFFFCLTRANLNHIYISIFPTGDQIKIVIFFVSKIVIRVYFKFIGAVMFPNSHRAHRPFPRNIGNSQSQRRPNYSQNIRIVFVKGKNRDNNLHFISYMFFKKRTNRSVHHSSA